MTTNLTRDQIEAMGDAEIAATREGLRRSVMEILCEIGAVSDIDPIDAARSLALTITRYGRAEGWTDAQLHYAVGYLAEVGRELQNRFEVLAGALVDKGVEVWCHHYHVPALYRADSGCSACFCDGVHTTLAEAAKTCTHGADCQSHPGATGQHNYDGPQF